MELSDVWEKVATNQLLTPQEMDFLRISARETQQRNSFLSGIINTNGKINISFPFFPIYNTVLEQDTSSFTVQIPANAKHIFCIGAGRCTGAAYNEGVIGRFNGDSGANYRGGWDGGQNTTQIASQLTGRTEFFFGDFTAASASTAAEGSFFAFLPHTKANLWKSILSLRAVSQYSITDLLTLFYTAHWESVSPIESITFLAGTSSIAAGSLFAVYGIE